MGGGFNIRGWGLYIHTYLCVPMYLYICTYLEHESVTLPFNEVFYARLLWMCFLGIPFVYDLDWQHTFCPEDTILHMKIDFMTILEVRTNKHGLVLALVLEARATRSPGCSEEPTCGKIARLHRISNPCQIACRVGKML